MKQLKTRFKEALSSVIPVSAIVLLLSVTVSPLDTGVLVVFLFGTILLIAGMSLFTLGSEMSMSPLGEGIGVTMHKSKRRGLVLTAAFGLGVLITIAEPDLQVLAQQLPSVPNAVLIGAVAIGVGIFLVVATLRTLRGLKLRWMLPFFYGIIMILAFFAPEDFLPVAFDSGGVTTGPITVPFIMAMGTGLAALRSDRQAGEDNFGLIALCSIGPIISVLLLSIVYHPEAEASQTVMLQAGDTQEALMQFIRTVPRYMKEMLVAFVPMVLVFVLFQLFFRRFRMHQAARVSMGMLYTFAGLVLFLTGANVGFMPAGQLIGKSIAQGNNPVLLIPIGMLLGYFTVVAEPAVHTLKRQVQEVSNGRITQNSISVGLSAGVAVSVGISMVRILTGVSIWPFLIVLYGISLAISFFVPPIYTGVAFDSGGVASGPMTTTFILPFALGACESVGGNIFTDAFGVVAMVAVTPLVTIQGIGLVSELRRKQRLASVARSLTTMQDSMIYYDLQEEQEDE